MIFPRLLAHTQGLVKQSIRHASGATPIRICSTKIPLAYHIYERSVPIANTRHVISKDVKSNGQTPSISGLFDASTARDIIGQSINIQSICIDTAIGSPGSIQDSIFHTDSVLRKRRLKMKKHKLRKRRRAQRSLMKRLGKL